jgi:hypothetical protein
MFQIRSDIPAPVTLHVGRPASPEYPFVDLAVKDSFFVPIGTEKSSSVINRVRTRAQRWKKTSGLTDTKFRICLFKHPDSDAQAVGVWRIA